MVREIIEIDEEFCVGCGNCVPNCHQGALQIIDGKARLISDLMCEGIGVCVGHCPTGAMTIEKREAQPYDEEKVMQKIAAGGANVIRAHLEHLTQHGQNEYLSQAIRYLNERSIPNPLEHPPVHAVRELSSGTAGGDAGKQGCPGAAARTVGPVVASNSSPDGRSAECCADYATESASCASRLRQWPVQLHLLNPSAAYLQGADVLLAADCTAYACGNFHKRFLRGKALAIACPKLDDGQQQYLEKLVLMIDQARINTLSVLIMEVPCCRGLLAMAKAAAERAVRRIPVKAIVLSVEGEVLMEEWV
ncbi:MAG: 4Fe-4S ferredoxin [Spirochaetaceae bacterium]|nr:MAG: 4Fe-4S ferredoxin [Spirochaetaceae bacterium]